MLHRTDQAHNNRGVLSAISLAGSQFFFGGGGGGGGTTGSITWEMWFTVCLVTPLCSLTVFYVAIH